MSKSQKKNQLFFQNIFNKIAIFKKNYRFLENIAKGIFLDSGGSSRHFDNLFTCLDLIIKLRINYFQHRVELTKNYENHVNFIF